MILTVEWVAKNFDVLVNFSRNSKNILLRSVCVVLANFVDFILILSIAIFIDFKSVIISNHLAISLEQARICIISEVFCYIFPNCFPEPSGKVLNKDIFLDLRKGR